MAERELSNYKTQPRQGSRSYRPPSRLSHNGARSKETIIDNRTGKQYEIPIEEGGVIRASYLRNIKTGPDDFGLMSYDPAFTNTASCRSKITFIDGEKGILRYRGYPIEELAERSNYLEVAYLIV